MPQRSSRRRSTSEKYSRRARKEIDGHQPDGGREGEEVGDDADEQEGPEIAQVAGRSVADPGQLGYGEKGPQQHQQQDGCEQFPTDLGWVDLIPVLPLHGVSIQAGAVDFAILNYQSERLNVKEYPISHGSGRARGVPLIVRGRSNHKYVESSLGPAARGPDSRNAKICAYRWNVMRRRPRLARRNLRVLDRSASPCWGRRFSRLGITRALRTDRIQHRGRPGVAEVLNRLYIQTGCLKTLCQKRSWPGSQSTLCPGAGPTSFSRFP